MSLPRLKVSEIPLGDPGLKPEYRNLGIPVVLADKIAYYILPGHYQDCDASLILEDNGPIIKITDLFGGRYYKRWRIYDLPLR